MNAEIIHAVERLQALEPAWWSLWRRIPGATVFTSPAWLIPWWQAFAPGDLWTVAVWDGPALRGLAPLYRENGVTRRLLPLGISLSDDADVLLDPGCSRASSAIIQALDDVALSWDVWSAEELRSEAAVLNMGVPESWVSIIAPQSACPVLTLPEGENDLARTIPARKLRKWRMAENRTARRGGQVEAVTTPDAIPDALSALFRLHGDRWRSRGEPGVLADATVQRFHRDTAPALLAAGLLRFTLLHIEGVVAGAHYGFQHGSWAAAYLGGFDPAFGFESPGTVLQGRAIETALQDGARTFSFLRGQEAYKYEWGAVDRWSSRRTFTPNRP